jgi:hypothetical protein
MIELAAGAWGVGAGEALRRLAEAGVPLPADALDARAVETYVGTHPAARQRATAFWAAARAAYHDHQTRDVAVCRRLHHLRLDVSPARWRDGPGLLVGAAHHRAAERVFHPAAGADRDRPDSRNASRGRLFKGRRWGEVLACAFHDAPGRIRAFAFVGRDGRRPGDEVFRRIGGEAMGAEAGIAGWAAVLAAADSRDVVAVDDWLFALQVQFRNFRTSLRPLPIVAWHDDGRARTRAAWDMAAGRRVTFWARDVDRRVVMQAAACDGRISLVGPEDATPASMAHYLRRHPGADLTRTVVENAKPWPVALRRWMDESRDGRVDELLRGLEEAGADVPHLLRQCGGTPGGGGAAGPHAAPRVARSVQVGPHRVVELGDAWVVEPRKGHGVRREVCNCVIRIRHAVKDRETGRLYYHGVVRHAGRRLEFLDDAAPVRDRTGKWLQALLTDRGAGVAAYASAFARNMFQAAVLFHTPEFVTDDLWRWTERVAEARRQQEHA